MTLSFIRGLVAAVNPCGFILLPTYLMYFLGLEGVRPGTQRATLRRALLVSASLSAGFIAVFLVAGAISYNFTTWINENSKYATVVIGASLLVLGIAMLFGYKLPFMTPDLRTRRHHRTHGPRRCSCSGSPTPSPRSAARSGCSSPPCSARRPARGWRPASPTSSPTAPAWRSLVSALTIALAFANTSLLKVLRSGMPYVDRIAAAFVVLSGLYLLWYFYWVDLREDGDPITDWAQDRQAQATRFLDDHWRVVAVVLIVVVGAAISYVWFRPDADAVPDERDEPEVPSVHSGPVPARTERSEVVDRPGLRREFVTMVGMGDRDQVPRPFLDRPATQLGDAPFGDHLVDGVLRRGHDIAGGQLRNDP